jgi:hypothetical protein
MPGDKMTIAEELYWAYRGRTDPADAVKQMMRLGYTVEQVRDAIDSLIWVNRIDDVEAGWLRGAVNMLSSPARGNPGPIHDKRPMMFKHFEEHIEEVQKEPQPLC